MQAEASFQPLHPAARIGRCTGAREQTDRDPLFVSAQTLGQVEHLERGAPDHSDYVVVDEFHHAAAPTYRCLLQHLHPRFLLGLMATRSAWTSRTS